MTFDTPAQAVVSFRRMYQNCWWEISTMKYNQGGGGLTQVVFTKSNPAMNEDQLLPNIIPKNSNLFDCVKAIEEGSLQAVSILCCFVEISGYPSKHRHWHNTERTNLMRRLYDAKQDANELRRRNW